MGITRRDVGSWVVGFMCGGVMMAGAQDMEQEEDDNESLDTIDEDANSLLPKIDDFEEVGWSISNEGDGFVVFEKYEEVLWSSRSITVKFSVERLETVNESVDKFESRTEELETSYTEEDVGDDAVVTVVDGMEVRCLVRYKNCVGEIEYYELTESGNGLAEKGDIVEFAEMLVDEWKEYE